MDGETAPLIGQRSTEHENSYGGFSDHEASLQQLRAIRIRTVTWSALTLVFIVAIVIFLMDPMHLRDHGWSGMLPKDPALAARRLLDMAPIIVRSVVLAHSRFHSMTSVIQDGHIGE